MQPLPLRRDLLLLRRCAILAAEEGMPMTEAEWLACNHPRPMLEFLRGKVSDRKLRLFACGCCRRLGEWYSDHQRAAVALAEDFADGLATVQELINTGLSIRSNGRGWVAPWAVTKPNAWMAAQMASQYAARCSFPNIACEILGQTEFLRHIAGDPFRTVVIDGAHRSSVARDIAARAYQARDFSDMPILADALEDAGCTNRDILDHCRQPGEHVRGCWVVDLVLGKE